MIQLEKVCYRVIRHDGVVEILTGIDLRVGAGEIVGLVGPSGSGKSSLLAMIAGVERPTSGRVRVLGNELTTLSGDALARVRRGIGVVFQDFHLVPAMTALENVALPLELAGAAEAEARAAALLAAVGLADRLDHRPGELSGGEQQRVAIARAFVASPRLLLADEPTGNLDQETSRRVMDLLWQMVEAQGVTLLLVTHDQALARRARRLLQLDHGRLVGGTP